MKPNGLNQFRSNVTSSIHDLQNLHQLKAAERWKSSSQASLDPRLSIHPHQQIMIKFSKHDYLYFLFFHAKKWWNVQIWKTQDHLQI